MFSWGLFSQLIAAEVWRTCHNCLIGAAIASQSGSSLVGTLIASLLLG